jgi:hypothetical protein
VSLGKIREGWPDKIHVPSVDDIVRLDVGTIRNIFRDEPGVLKIGEKNPRGRRMYLTLHISESVAVRVHKRLSE